MSTEAAEGASIAPRSSRRIYHGYYIMAVALLAQFVTSFTQGYVSSVFLEPMTADLGWTRSQFVSGQSIGSFVLAFAGVFIGGHVDRGRARPLMLVGVTIFGLSLIATSQVTEYWQWVLARGFTTTIGAALMGNLVVNAVLSKWWVERRGQAMGMSALGISLAGVLLPPVMTRIVDEYGWQLGWVVLGALSWILIYPASSLVRTTPEEMGLHPDNKSDVEMTSERGDRIRADFANSLTRREAVRTPAFYTIVLAFGLAGIGLGTMLQQTLPFSTSAGFDRTTAAWMVTALALPAAITKPFWGMYMDRVSEKVAAATGFFICAGSMLVILAGAHAQSTALLAAGFLSLGVGIGGQVPIQETIWGTYFGRRYIGEVRSIAMPFAIFLGAGGPLGVAYYFDRVGNYDGAFLGLAFMWALAAVLLLLLKRPVAIDRGALPVDRRSPEAALSRREVGESDHEQGAVAIGKRRGPAPDYGLGRGLEEAQATPRDYMTSGASEVHAGGCWM